MRAAAEKAIQLDPMLAEAYDALGMAYARDGQWKESEKSFLHAIKLDSSGSVWYGHFAANVLLPLGRIQEAIQQVQAAVKTDPLSALAQFTLANVLLSAGRYDEAADQCERLPDGSELKSQCLGRARSGQGRTGEALEIFARAVDRGVPAGSVLHGYLGYSYGHTGRRVDAESLASSVSQYPFQQALIFAGLGDKDRTLEALDRMAVQGPVRIGRTLAYPEFALLRGDPRVKVLRKKVGLPE